jgi:hypothetical protein
MLCLEDGLVDHVEFLIMDFDALVQFRYLLLDDEVLLLALHQFQLIDELLILLQLFEVGVDPHEVTVELRAVEQLDPLPLCASLLVPIIELVHIVNLIEVANVVADFSQEADLTLPESIFPRILQL